MISNNSQNETGNPCYDTNTKNESSCFNGFQIFNNATECVVIGVMTFFPYSLTLCSGCLKNKSIRQNNHKYWKKIRYGCEEQPPRSIFYKYQKKEETVRSPTPQLSPHDILSWLQILDSGKESESQLTCQRKHYTNLTMWGQQSESIRSV